MNQTLIFNLLALAALLPASVLPVRGEKSSRDWVFWVVLALAWLGPFLWAGYAMSGVWKSGFSITLWVTIAVSLTLFALLATFVRDAWRLTPLMSPYMMALGVVATLFWHQGSGSGLTQSAPGGWVGVHIVVSLITYGLVTVAAVAALAAFIQDRALKLKRPNKLTHMLPSVTDCEGLSVRLLGWGEMVLGVGLASGMATKFMETGDFLSFDHKTVLSFAAFAIIGAILLAHHKTGMRGRKVARLVLLAYLLLSLGYVGVKLVTDVLMA
ncbi:MAG: cytochrome c biogenesis protein CcsA [Rhodospirillaceae bacterium]|nr:cytochrome c biogenesis protein CcsA [Rhodospirillaceae bacterium]